MRASRWTVRRVAEVALQVAICAVVAAYAISVVLVIREARLRLGESTIDQAPDCSCATMAQ